MGTLGENTACLQKVTQCPNANVIHLLTDSTKQLLPERDQPFGVYTGCQSVCSLKLSAPALRGWICQDPYADSGPITKWQVAPVW